MASQTDEDYYSILGVARDVGDDGLKRAYKRQALRWHPDKHQNGPSAAIAEERFKKVAEAYQALSDKRRRSEYNRRRHRSGSSEVLYSKTYGWSGANISFYWTGPAPQKEGSDSRKYKKKTSRKADDAESTATEGSRRGSTGTEESRRSSRSAAEEAESTTTEGTAEASRSPLELFREMFEIEGSPLAALDRQLDKLKRRGSIFGSVFGLGEQDQHSSSQDEQRRDNADDGNQRSSWSLGGVVNPNIEAQNKANVFRAPSTRNGGLNTNQPESVATDQQACCTMSMKEREQRLLFITEEFQKGDLSEEEFKDLVNLLAQGATDD